MCNNDSRNNNLSLCNFQNSSCNIKNISTYDIFQYSGNNIFADWFTGDLIASYGPEIKQNGYVSIPFYEKYGFVAYGPEFDEAGIRHFAMKLVL